jgi:predicted ester cyclase
VHGIDELRVSGGKIVERWGQVDQLGLMRQLGVIPSPEQAQT